MIKIDAKKDGKGNIIITEDSFEMLLACIDNGMQLYAVVCRLCAVEKLRIGAVIASTV